MPCILSQTVKLRVKLFQMKTEKTPHFISKILSCLPSSDLTLFLVFLILMQETSHLFLYENVPAIARRFAVHAKNTYFKRGGESH